MRFLKRIFWAAAGLLTILLVVGSIYWFSGSSAVESWVGSQLLRIGASYLEPEAHFERLTYLRPRTILLDNLTLTSPDPAQPGRKIVILAAKKVRLELTEIPRQGEPIKFSEVILESPEFRGVATPSGLLGFSHMLKGSVPVPGAETAENDKSPPGPVPATTAQPANSPMKLSDWLLIRRVEIKNGSISYDPRKRDTPPLWLDGINARLDFTPVDAQGLYKLATTISRKPAFELVLDGRINMDTFEADLAKLDFALDLREENAHYLPPDLQRMLKSHEVTGQLRASAKGKLPLTQLQRSSLEATLDLTQAQVAAGENRIVIEAWNMQGEMRDGIATLQKADARLLGGEMGLTGTIPLQGTQPVRLTLNASGLKIQQLLRSLKPGEMPRYAGSVGANITLTAPRSSLVTHAGGEGTFTLREGRLGAMPVLGPILVLLNKSFSKALGIENQKLTDSADGTLSFTGDRIRIDKLNATSGAMALRGSGTLAFNGTLDMRVNAGPLELIQNSLGAIGSLWGVFSDALVGYRIHGTLTAPKVSVEVGR